MLLQVRSPTPVLRSVPVPVNVVLAVWKIPPLNSATAPEAIATIGDARVFWMISVPRVTVVAPV